MAKPEFPVVAPLATMGNVLLVLEVKRSLAASVVAATVLGVVAPTLPLKAPLVLVKLVKAPVLGVTAPIVVLLIVALTMGTAPTHEVPSQRHE
jgi:hypothetical protein